MAEKRHAEIAGAGITGLAAAAALAQRGWSVRVHERALDLREIGAGIFLKENSIRALGSIGAFERLAPSSVRLMEGKVVDEKQRVLLHRLTHEEQSFATLRGALHRALSETASELGADIVRNSPVEGATPDGEIILESGRRYRADLVIGADGFQSKIRQSLGLLKSIRTLPVGATRLLVPRTEQESKPMQQEHWSLDCRMGFTPCSPTDVYIFLVCPEDNADAVSIPVKRGFWVRRFPHLRHLIDRIPDDVGSHTAFVLVDVKAWHSGRVSILGDAAHAQPPNLGQGAGMGIANALALAEHLDATSDIPEALSNWEADRRAVSEAVKRWSHFYGLLSSHWPSRALSLRSALIWSLGHARFTRTKWGWLWRGGMMPQGEGR